MRLYIPLIPDFYFPYSNYSSIPLIPLIYNIPQAQVFFPTKVFLTQTGLLLAGINVAPLDLN